jgi:hypothetical protein
MAPPLSKLQNEILQDIYYKQNMAYGRDKIRASIKIQYPDSKISQRQISEWLKTQKKFITDINPDLSKITRIISPTVHDNVASYIVKWKGKKTSTIEPKHLLMNKVPKMIDAYNKKKKIYWYKTGGINKFGINDRNNS